MSEDFTPEQPEEFDPSKIELFQGMQNQQDYDFVQLSVLLHHRKSHIQPTDDKISVPPIPISVDTLAD